MHRSILVNRIIPIILVICTVFSMSVVMTVTSSAAPALPAVNTETRHAQTCTSLSSDAQAYYTGSYTYANLSALSGASNTSTSANAMQNNQLYNALQTLMTSTHSFQTSYSGTGAGSLAYYWQRTDAQNGVSGSFVLVYCDNVVSINSGSSGFNREHVWPKSNASFNQSNGGSDLHHLRPADPTINSTRSNLPFGNVRAHGGNYTTGSCYWKTSSLFEPADNVKGDVARILLYVYVRWGENNIYSDTSNGNKIIESLDTLLEWIALDPVDTWEMKRNDLTQDVQGNRNVFIDYPELAYLMFGRSIPTNLITPTRSGCNHNWVKLSETAATCTQSGSTTYRCTICQETRVDTVPATGHTEVIKSQTAATCTTDGSRVYECTVCGNLRAESIPALGHSFGTGTITVEPTCTDPGVIEYPCTRCGYIKTTQLDAYGHNYNEGTVTLAPTCTEEGEKTYLCARCGGTYTEAIPALGHTDPGRDGICDRCGAEVEIPEGFEIVKTVTDGMHLFIYHPNQGKAISPESSGVKLLGVTADVSGSPVELPDGAALFVVSVQENGFYLINNGKYLTTAAKGNSLTLEDEPNDYSLWRLEDAGGDLVYIYNVNAAYTSGNYNQAIEYYNGGYTVYGQKNTAIYQYVLYAVSGHEFSAPVFTWDGFTATAVHTCTLCGCTENLDVTVTSEITMPATCHQPGVRTYTATATVNGIDYTSTVTEELEISEHQWDNGVVTVPAGVGVEGTIVYTCLICGETWTDTIPALTAIKGDLNMDGFLRIDDVSLMLNAVAGQFSPDFAIADMNNDNVINIIDVSRLLNALGKQD